MCCHEVLQLAKGLEAHVGKGVIAPRADGEPRLLLAPGAAAGAGVGVGTGCCRGCWGCLRCICGLLLLLLLLRRLQPLLLRLDCSRLAVSVATGSCWGGGCDAGSLSILLMLLLMPRLLWRLACLLTL